MQWHGWLLVLAIPLGLAVPAPAGIFFHRKEKNANEEQHISELLGTVKADPDAHKRVTAAEELRQYDAKAHPEIPAILIDVLQHDDKAEVRAEAAATLGKLRPVGPDVGQALEQALASDKSSKVRWQARTALWHYRLSGYRTPKEEGPAVSPPTNQEPPLAKSKPAPAPPVVNVKPVPPTPQPAPRIAPVPTWSPVAPPSSNGSTRPPLVPTEPPALKSPPTVDPGGGPNLAPPG